MLLWIFLVCNTRINNSFVVLILEEFWVKNPQLSRPLHVLSTKTRLAGLILLLLLHKEVKELIALPVFGC